MEKYDIDVLDAPTISGVAFTSPNAITITFDDTLKNDIVASTENDACGLPCMFNANGTSIEVVDTTRNGNKLTLLLSKNVTSGATVSYDYSRYNGQSVDTVITGTTKGAMGNFNIQVTKP